jgi:hypothetical protein
MILQSFKSLFTNNSHVKFGILVFIFFSTHYWFNLLPRYEPVPAGGGRAPLNMSKPSEAMLHKLLLDWCHPLISHVCHRSGHDLFLCGHKSIVRCASQLRLVVGHVAFQ